MGVGGAERWAAPDRTGRLPSAGSSPSVLCAEWSPAESQEIATPSAGLRGSVPGPWVAGQEEGRAVPAAYQPHLPLHKAAPLSPRHRRQRRASASSPTHTAGPPLPAWVRLVLGSRQALTHPARAPRDLHSPGWFPKPSPVQDPRQRCPWPYSTHEDTEAHAQRGHTAREQHSRPWERGEGWVGRGYASCRGCLPSGRAVGRELRVWTEEMVGQCCLWEERG